MRSLAFGRAVLVSVAASAAAVAMAACHTSANTPALGSDDRPAIVADARRTGISIEDSVRALEHAWADAIRMRDSATLERLVAPEFTVSSGAAATTTRPPVSRAIWMENTLRRLRVDSIRLSPARVTVHGDTAMAMLTFIWAGQFMTTPPFRDSTELTDTWVRSADTWRVHRRVLTK